MAIERTKEELIEVLGMLPINGKDLTYNLTDVFNRVKNVILETKIVEPEVDTELEEAKKLIGTWILTRDGGYYQVYSVERGLSNKESIYIRKHGQHDDVKNYQLIDIRLVKTNVTPPISPIKGHCCIQDPPEKPGRYLVINKNGSSDCLYFSINKTWYLRTREQVMKHGDMWYELPDIEGA